MVDVMNISEVRGLVCDRRRDLFVFIILVTNRIR